MHGHGQGRVRGQRSLSHPSRESHGKKERASKEMQEQAGVTRKLPRSGLVQPPIIDRASGASYLFSRACVCQIMGTLLVIDIFWQSLQRLRKPIYTAWPPWQLPCHRAGEAAR